MFLAVCEREPPYLGRLFIQQTHTELCSVWGQGS